MLRSQQKVITVNMNKKEKLKEQIKLELSNLILYFLEEGERIMNSRSLMQHTMYDLRKMYKVQLKEKQEKEKLKRKFYNSIQYLKKAKLITAIKKEGNIYYELTEKGKLKNLFFKINKKIDNDKELKHLIIFDIPEDKKRVRELLRRTLYNLSYDKIQKSCFYSKSNNSYDLLLKIIKDANISDYVLIFKIK